MYAINEYPLFYPGLGSLLVVVALLVVVVVIILILILIVLIALVVIDSTTIAYHVLTCPTNGIYEQLCWPGNSWR